MLGDVPVAAASKANSPWSMATGRRAGCDLAERYRASPSDPTTSTRASAHGTTAAAEVAADEVAPTHPRDGGGHGDHGGGNWVRPWNSKKSSST